MRRSIDAGSSEGALAIQFRRTALNATTAYCLFIATFTDHVRVQEKQLRAEVSALAPPAHAPAKRRLSESLAAPPPTRTAGPPAFPILFHSRFLWRSLLQNEAAARVHGEAVAALRQAATNSLGAAEYAYGGAQLHFIAGNGPAAVALAEETAILNPRDADAAALRCAMLVATGVDAQFIRAEGGGGAAGPSARPNVYGTQARGGEALAEQEAADRLAALQRAAHGLQAAILADPGSRTAAEAGLRLVRTDIYLSSCLLSLSELPRHPQSFSAYRAL